MPIADAAKSTPDLRAAIAGARSVRIRSLVLALCLVLIVLGAPTAAAAPTRLSGAVLDSITAGQMTLQANLSAYASGPTAFTSTSATTSITQGEILIVSPDPRAPAVLHVSNPQLVELGYGYGKAVATGASDARCSATMNLAAQTIMRQTSSALLRAPTSAICLCSVIAVAPVH